MKRIELLLEQITAGSARPIGRCRPFIAALSDAGLGDAIDLVGDPSPLIWGRPELTGAR